MATAQTPPGAYPIEVPNLGSRGEPFDCAIIGGGPAGLSAAIYLGRLRRTTVVIDAHEGRSLWYQVNHNYLGFPDGVEAAELRKLGRRQATNYGTLFGNGEVTGIQHDGDLFCVQLGPALPLDAEPEQGSQERRLEDTADAQAQG